MTARSRKRRSKAASRAAFNADEPITEVLKRVQPADWDGTTIDWPSEPDVVHFEGASAVGVMPAPAATAPPRQDAAPPAMPRGRPGYHPADFRPDAMDAACPACHRYICICGEPKPAPPAATDAGLDRIARELLEGWPHLAEIRCAYPAATAATPIPCGRAYRNDRCRSFPGLYAGAYAEGWRADAFGNWACDRCAQLSPLFRTARPLTHSNPELRARWAAGLPFDEAYARAVTDGVRGQMWDVLDGDGHPVTGPHGRVLTVAAEHVLTVRAERGLRDRTLRHYDSSHKRGTHADGAQ